MRTTYQAQANQFVRQFPRLPYSHLHEILQYFYLSDSHYSNEHHHCGTVHYVCGLAVSLGQVLP